MINLLTTWRLDFVDTFDNDYDTHLIHRSLYAHGLPASRSGYLWLFVIYRITWAFSQDFWWGNLQSQLVPVGDHDARWGREGGRGELGETFDWSQGTPYRRQILTHFECFKHKKSFLTQFLSLNGIKIDVKLLFFCFKFLWTNLRSGNKLWSKKKKEKKRKNERTKKKKKGMSVRWEEKTNQFFVGWGNPRGNLEFLPSSGKMWWLQQS